MTSFGVPLSFDRFFVVWRILGPREPSSDQPETVRAGTPQRRGEDVSLLGGSLYIDETVAHGEQESLEPRVHPELAEDAHDVVAHRTAADVQASGDLLVAQALGEQPEHLPLPGSELFDAPLRLAIPLSPPIREPEQLD